VTGDQTDLRKGDIAFFPNGDEKASFSYDRATSRLTYESENPEDGQLDSTEIWKLRIEV
jgi:hypothetical protein